MQPLLSTVEAAAFLGISVRTVRRYYTFHGMGEWVARRLVWTPDDLKVIQAKRKARQASLGHGGGSMGATTPQARQRSTGQQ